MSGGPTDRDPPFIRTARSADLPALVRILNHYVHSTHVTFDTQEFTEEQRRPWFAKFAATGPYRLHVAEIDLQPVGYAASTRFRPKAAYDTSVETTIYLDPACLGDGVGRRLYAHLLDALLAEPAVHRAYGGIALPNPASIALHESLGFKLVGVMREVGFKFGKYWDVSWYEKDLSSPAK